MIQDPNHDLGAGTIDQGQAIATLGKSLGYVSREGNQWVIKGIDGAWPKKEDLWYAIQTDQVLQTELMRILTVSARRDAGLVDLPPDRYLFGQVD